MNINDDLQAGVILVVCLEETFLDKHLSDSQNLKI